MLFLQNDNQRGLRQRWELIQEGLLKTIMSCQQLETAVLSYNSKYSKSWDFTTLRILFNEILSEEETDNFFTTLLPQIIQLALQLPTLLTTPVPLLVQHRNHTLSFSQLQIASLLANAFLCTFPRRNTAKRQSEFATYPDINFNRYVKLKYIFILGFSWVSNLSPFRGIGWEYVDTCIHISNGPLWFVNGIALPQTIPCTTMRCIIPISLK